MPAEGCAAGARAGPACRRVGLVHKIYALPVSSVYPHYVTKVEKKGRTEAELREVMCWLTGFRPDELAGHLAAHTSFADFFAAARLPAGAHSISGTICGVRIAEITDPLMRQIRYLDKVVDELAKGRPVAKIMRPDPAP